MNSVLEESQSNLWCGAQKLDTTLAAALCKDDICQIIFLNFIEIRGLFIGYKCAKML